MKVQQAQIDQLRQMMAEGTLTGEMRERVARNLVRACRNSIDMPGQVSLVDMTTGKTDWSKITDDQIEWLISHVETI